MGAKGAVSASRPPGRGVSEPLGGPYTRSADSARVPPCPSAGVPSEAKVLDWAGIPSLQCDRNKSKACDKFVLRTAPFSFTHSIAVTLVNLSASDSYLKTHFQQAPTKEQKGRLRYPNTQEAACLSTKGKRPARSSFRLNSQRAHQSHNKRRPLQVLPNRKKRRRKKDGERGMSDS